jgi:autotransporter-associated beta strand protein
MASSSATGGSIVKDGSNTLIIQSTGNTYTGNTAAGVAANANGTRIGGGILGIFGDTSLGLAPSTATNNVFFTTSAISSSTDPTLQDTSGNITLAATRNLNIASGVTARFDSNGNTFGVAGVINGNGGNLNKIGAGTLVLTGANTYTGTTTVSAGTLNAAATNALGGTTGSITVNRGGTLLVSGDGNLDRINDNTPIVLGSPTGTGTATFQRGAEITTGAGVSEGTGASRNGVTLTNTPSTPGLGALSLQSNATFDFGSGGVGTFTFGGNFTANGNTLTILGWTSNASALAVMSGVDGTDDRLIFNGAPTDIAFINFNGTPATFIPLDGTFYEVVPVPETSTWVTGALALAAIGFMSRKSRRAKPATSPT